MKTDQQNQLEEVDEEQIVAGDVIGDTAYSERFVLKILIKLANIESLKTEIQEKSFEDDLCTLWDMTAERDVVLFLQKHDILNLFNFALPVVDSSRILEIIIGIISNMCCQKEIANKLIETEETLLQIMEYITSDDSLVLIQIFRLVSHCLYEAEEIATWLDLFNKVEYSKTLYFILKNSSSKYLLSTCLENLNTVCSICNTEATRSKFFSNFVTTEAIEALSIAFQEVTIKQKDECDQDEIERIIVISLQITLVLIGFDVSLELYSESEQFVTSMIGNIYNYYENKFVNQKEIDSDLVDIIESTVTIINTLKIKGCSKEVHFDPGFKIWKIVRQLNSENTNGSSTYEDDCNIEEIQGFSQQIIVPLSNLLSIYLDICKENELVTILNEIKDEYAEIISLVEDSVLKLSLSKKTAAFFEKFKPNGS